MYNFNIKIVITLIKLNQYNKLRKLQEIIIAISKDLFMSAPKITLCEIMCISYENTKKSFRNVFICQNFISSKAISIVVKSEKITKIGLALVLNLVFHASSKG